MKIKSGFISNSSSSSFICTIGRIVDETKFNAWMKGNQIKDIRIVTTDDILGNVGLLPSNDTTIWGDFENQIPSDILLIEIQQDEIEKNNNRFIISEGHGPSDFEVYDADGEYIEEDYDNINLTDFSKTNQIIYHSSPETNGVKVIYKCYYAGRNG